MTSATVASPEVMFVLPPGGLTLHFAEHLGTAFLRSVLAEAGIRSLQFLPRRSVGLSSFAGLLREQRPRVVGFTAYEANLRGCRALARVVRETLPETVILVGGPNATFTPDDTLDRLGADVCLRGAGEARIAEVAGALLGAHTPRRELESLLGGITNLVLRTRTGTAHTRLTDLSSFPGGRFRTLDDLPSPYLGGFIDSADTGLLTGRGCNQHCTYCSFATISDRRVHYHSVDRVLDDLTALAAIAERKQRRRPKVSINDDAFTLSPARARRICEGIIDRDLRLALVCQTRVDCVEPDLLRLMKRAGFVGLTFGIESAVPRVLRAIGKVQDPHSEDDPRYEREREYLERVRRAVSESRRAGMQPSVSVIGGLPGETARDFRTTLAFVESLGVAQYAHNVLAVLPGTPLYATRHEHGLDAGRDTRTGRWRTKHTYDVGAVRVARGAEAAVGNRREAREITDALCGRARPERACDDSAWAVVVHDQPPRDRLTKWINDVLAVHGTIVVTSTPGRLRRSDHEAWLAALERSRTAWGLFALLSRHRSTRQVEIYRSVEASGSHEIAFASAWSAVRRRLRSDKSGNCQVPIWLASTATAPPRVGRLRSIVDHAPQVADSCRWGSEERRCLHPAVLHAWPDDNVTACWGGPALGRVGDGVEALVRGGLELARGGAHRLCPIAPGSTRSRDVSQLEVASMLTWLLEREVNSDPGGTPAWSPRRQAKAVGRRKRAEKRPASPAKPPGHRSHGGHREPRRPPLPCETAPGMRR